MRFDLTFQILAPEIEIITPTRDMTLAYAVASADGFDFAYGFDGIVEMLAVYGLDLAIWNR